MKGPMFRSRFLRAVSLFVLMCTGAIGAAEQMAKDGNGQEKESVPTFTKDVAPILHRSCISCHRPDTFAPMSLLTYETARPWAKAIKRVTTSREMPPWYIDRNIGIQEFKKDPSLSDEEIALIADWVDAGAPMGNPADMPEPPNLPDPTAWQLGIPELIIKSEVMHVPAAGPDEWGNVNAEADTPPLTEDRWIRAVEVKPVTGQRTVHHSGAYQVFPQDEGVMGPLGQLITMYVVGKNGDIYPEGVGMPLKAGSKVRFNYHVHPIGEETAAQVAVGFYFHPKGYEPKYVHSAEVFGGDYELETDIPAGVEAVRSDGYAILTEPAVITQFEPHMHNRGRAMCLELIYPQLPDGEMRGYTRSIYSRNAVQTETVNCIDRYDFEWIRTYVYEDDVAPVVPAGTLMHFIMWHTNSPTHRKIFDTTNWIGFGQGANNEMAHAWMGYYYISEEEYQRRIAERKATGEKNKPGSVWVEK